MAEESFPFQELAQGDRTVSAAMFAKHLGMLRSRGIVIGVDNGLLVAQSAPAAMSVDLDTGAAFVGLTEQRAYRNTLARTLTIATADPTNPRHDLVVLDMDTATGPPDDRRVTATIVQGTPAATPTDPALVQTESHYQIPLARVLVGAGAGSIVDANITDLRLFSTANNVSAGLSLVGSNTTEASTTSTSAVDLSSVSGLSIPTNAYIAALVTYRQTSGGTATAILGLKLNSTVVNDFIPVSAYQNATKSGVALFIVGPRLANYLRAGMVVFGGSSSLGTTTDDVTAITADMPAATITDFVIRGRTDNAAATFAVDEVRVYTLAT